MNSFVTTTRDAFRDPKELTPDLASHRYCKEDGNEHKSSSLKYPFPKESYYKKEF